MARSLRTASGFTLAEILTVVAILGVIVLSSVPAFFNLRRRHAVRAAAAEIRAVFHLARSRAIARSTNTAIRFRKHGNSWHYAIYEDGDRDGVRNDDIAAGRDPVVTGYRKLLQGAGGAEVGLPDIPLTDPDTRQRIARGASPVQFNRSQLCSFSPIGGGTAGSIYLTDGHDLALVVRVYGATGKIRTLSYNRGSSRWESR
jgi:prepilin-type N-terminal cleavage/methylation domain-containing protein